MAQAYERIIAASAPLTTKGVLWINTSVNPHTLNVFINGQWKIIGSANSIEDWKLLQKILENIDTIKTSITSLDKRVENIDKYIREGQAGVIEAYADEQAEIINLITGLNS